MGVGFAVVKVIIIMQHKLPEITSIFSAENYAIYETIKLANTLELNNTLIIIKHFNSTQKLLYTK